MRFYELVDAILAYMPQANMQLLEKAYVFVSKAYRDKNIGDGPYLNHPLAIGSILARMRLDEESIAAGLLHDSLEREYASPEELAALFGPDVCRIVQGVARLTQIAYGNRQERQAEYIRKMIMAISSDVRVVLVKLADRLDGIGGTLRGGDRSASGLARETLDIYAPLAGRLGIEWMKQDLENYSFRCLYPEAYAEIEAGLAKTEEDRLRYIREVQQTLKERMSEFGITGRIYGRSKHFYSIYLKMERQKLDLTRIHDLTAFRAIVDSVKSCYEALALIHALWEPVEGRYKDYIARPKNNMYQSLHTTVIGPYGERMEVQIRTEEMEQVANEGIAAHWMYKEGKPVSQIDRAETQRFSWFRQIMELSRDLEDGRGDSKSLMEALKVDFYPDVVYVFTPAGDVKAFPKGSTPVDFAYEVHTEVGHRCVGARVNGKLVPLRYELQNGDTVEVLTSASHKPSKDWLKQVKSSKALGRIRHWFKTEERERSISQGREICEREFRKKGLNFNNYLNSAELAEAAKGFSLKSVDDLLAGIGYHKITPNQVIGKLTALPPDEERPREEVVEKKKSLASKDGIKVDGLEDILIRMAQCCNPVPGEPVMGYITRGRGITVHRISCKNLQRGSDEGKKIDVQWNTGKELLFPVDIRVVYSGERDVLAALNAVLGQMDVNVMTLKVDRQLDTASVCHLRIEVKDSKHLQRVVSALKSERGVYRVQRSME
ncbi:MAG: bifunctional (p)ppGpp synthetase/guanosine-3',5'-bis(diphosphate) 3'-pyrophosphohydrolase [Syntrophobacteraceae bacterium]|nr:bifunctional (p)ppGpp synthetase/guanosine-3',5'-bis(diphosphate) 3'-pyrophosphohydrolase [Syntrophobacteraceae bacterium]